jgi:hypothetical protein
LLYILLFFPEIIVLNKNFILARYILTFREVYKYKDDLTEMKNLLKILTAITGKHIEKWIFGVTFRHVQAWFSYVSRMFLAPLALQLASSWP